MIENLFSTSQILGYVAFALAIYGVLQTDDRKMKQSMIIGYGFMIGHFYLLGSMVTAANTVVGTVRTIVSLKYNSVYMAIAFIGLYICSGLYFMDKPIDLLPVAGAVVNTIAIITMSGIRMRLVLMCSAVFGIANGIIIGSIGGLAIECTMFFLTGVTVFRMMKQEKEKLNAVS